MRFAYADPPYLGCGKYYSHPESRIWDKIESHKALIDRLVSEFPDGWALSLHTPSLRLILPLCPEKSRVAAWVKPYARFRPNVNPNYSWEPIIFYGGRKKRGRIKDTIQDWHSASTNRTLGLIGAKPASFCRWVADLLGWIEGDEMVDLFPGTNALALALMQRRLPI